MSHWAREYIGKPWSADGEGPITFNCWNLVRHIYRVRLGLELPNVTIDATERSLDNFRAIKNTGLRPIAKGDTSLPMEWDVVLMRGIRLHCGLVSIANGGRLGVLHSSHGMGVAWQSWNEAVFGMSTELWRRAGP